MRRLRETLLILMLLATGSLSTATVRDETVAETPGADAAGDATSAQLIAAMGPLLATGSLSTATVRDETVAETPGADAAGDATSAQLIAAMGPMAPPSEPEAGRRQGRQFVRRLSSQLQNQLSARGPPAGPVFRHSPSVVAVSSPTPTSPAPPPGRSPGQLTGQPPAPPPFSANAAPPAPVPSPPGYSALLTGAFNQPIPVSPPIGPPGSVSTQLVFAAPGGPPSPPSPPSPSPQPPSPPPPTARPAPILQGDSSIQATNIRCLQSSSREQLTATLLSSRPIVAPPVLTLRPAVNPLSSAVCAVTSSQDGRQLELEVTNLEACGVESCVQPNGERWLCLTMRFPLIAGIHLPEDDVIQIQCRPQDPSQTAGKQLLVQATGFENLSPVAFTGGGQEFECEVALFRRTPGSDMFSTVVTAGDTITLGEELHLRSIIRAGDGWQYSRLTDVLVERVAAQSEDALPSDSAPLVFSDGCRNEELSLIAPDHPTRHQTNQLISNFAFRVFTFQGMTSGDRLQVSARVTGCVEAADCAPALCSDGGQGFGRRRRRSPLLEGSNHTTTDWRRDLAFSVVIPDTHVLPPRAAAAAPARSISGCPAALLASLVAALAGCLLLLLTAVCLLNARQQRRLRASRCPPKLDQQPGQQLGRQQRHNGQIMHYECAPTPIDDDAGLVWPPGRPQHWQLEGAITAPRGRCTERRLKRRRADIRRSFSAGSFRCGCAERELEKGEKTATKQLNEKVNVSIVHVPAQENIYSEPKPRWDVAPTMV